MTCFIPNYKVNAQSVELSSEMKIKNFEYILPTGIIASSFQDLWKKGYTGLNIKVAIIDTGIDRSHPDLSNKVLISTNYTRETVIVNSHGTHVAGTIAANGLLKGGAPDAKLIDIKALSQIGGSIFNVIRGINFAVANGASVINMSIGTSFLRLFEKQLLERVITNAYNKGCICIAASGNDGISICTEDPFQYPASINIVESVAACKVDPSFNVELSVFSNENNRVDLAACGENVLSTVIGRRYSIFSGTSMATPHVSAMLALLFQQVKQTLPTLRGKNLSDEVLKRLRNNIFKVDACNNSISFGKGFLRYDPSKKVDVNTLKNRPYYIGGVLIGYEY